MDTTSSPPSQSPGRERFDEVVREYIDFINSQVGVYMDALAGFAGHYARVERQVHRVSRPTQRSTSPDGDQVVVWSSYEDPTKPDIIHNRIFRADDYLAVNARGGSNERQHAQAIIVFLYTAWESDVRPRLALARAVDVSDIRSDIMGDLKQLRHAIIHGRGILRADSYRKLKELDGMFQPDHPVTIAYEDMHMIFVKMKQDCARLMFEWLDVPDAAEKAKGMKDIAIQRPGRGRAAP